MVGVAGLEQRGDRARGSEVRGYPDVAAWRTPLLYAEAAASHFRATRGDHKATVDQIIDINKQRDEATKKEGVELLGERGRKSVQVGRGSALASVGSIFEDAESARTFFGGGNMNPTRTGRTGGLTG
ncbi:hypothetical protein DFH09DRAFT_1071361 [Mycena vulgaris]|nr:hypothetical protein DFH09DRAFT_1071361 [Mycena vulgaris]